MTPQEIQSFANDLLASHGLAVKGWKFIFNNRRRAFGVCSYKGKFIALSLPLCGINSDEKIKKTLLHEIAHALCPSANHGPVWKLQAMAIGADPQATCTDANLLPGRYSATCQCSIGTHFLYARPKVRTNRWHACGRCRQKLTWIDGATGEPVPPSVPQMPTPTITELYSALTGMTGETGND